jgi:N-acylneuraminate cytidylyltransferase
LRIALIPARGGSKRIPRKNIRTFAGRPMISHSIAAAARSGLFDRIVVSTDDEEIAGVARSFGAEVPFVRPPELSDDHTGTTGVVAHAIRALGCENLTAVCCIYATAPFIRDADIKRGLELLESGNWQYVFAATSFPAPVYRSFRQSASGGLEMLFPQYFSTRSQDLPEALHDAGQFYWGRPEAWLSCAKTFDALSTVVLLPRWRVHDIDSEEDWKRAELMWDALGAQGGRD